MNNELIYIDAQTMGVIGTLLILMFLFCIACFAVMLSVYISSKEKCDRVEKRNKFLRERLAAVESELQWTKILFQKEKKNV
jgi:uncharacterized membrane protein